MLRYFKEGSIRWQIVTLAVLPIILVGIFGIITEPLFPEDTNLTRAEVVAAQIALVADQVENAGSPEVAEAVLAATRKSGLEAHWVSSFTEESANTTTFQDRVLYSLSELHDRSAWAVTGTETEPVIVMDLGGRLLAFAPVVEFVPGLLNDDIVNILLSVVIIALPVAMLSIYAARLLTNPLTRIAAAAQRQSSVNPDGGIFDETGPREIRQLARRLNEMRSHIRGMLEQRTAMLRAVSHDLRTPLTRLKLRIERSVPVETAAILIRDIASINEMINETLNYLRSDGETETLRKSDLPSLLRTIGSDFSDVGFSVTYLGPDRLSYVCRPKALSRAISNLVDNGTKFGENVEIHLSALPGGGVQIDVSDDGQGIPEDMRTKVLEPFVKADPSRGSSSRSGFGLGLSIVQDVVRGHGGTVALQPRLPKGLNVSIVLPGGSVAAARGAVLG